MTRKCFFVEGINSGAESVNLPPDVSHHLESVLRVRAGEEIEIRDGFGKAWAARITTMRKGSVSVELLGARDFSGMESPLPVTLAFGFARTDLMDLLIRQATELGVAQVAAFRAARSQYRLQGAQAAKKTERWVKIMREAICQCGRTRVPDIAIFEDLGQFICSIPSAPEGTMKIFARERESAEDLIDIRRNRPDCASVVAAIGPEGGWEGVEISRLKESGFIPVHLGPRVLRYETAAVALISSVQLLWGDMGKKCKGGDEHAV